MRETKDRKFVLCIRNDECEDLELRKVYQILPDKKASQDGYPVSSSWIPKAGYYGTHP
jgi:hypothetical protein